MKCHLIVLGAATAAMTIAMMAPAPAQEPGYETPLYIPRPPQKPDPYFGLPTFGLPGADLPQKTMAPTAGVDAAQTAPGTEAPQSNSDFFKSADRSANDFPDVAGPDVSLPSDRRQTSNRMSSSTSDGTSSLLMDSTSSSTTDDTPLYTTTEGMTTGEIGSSSTTK